VEIVRQNPDRIGELTDGLCNEDARISMRMADALEKLSLENARWLQPYRARLLQIARNTNQQEIRWHMAQILPRLHMSPALRKEAYRTLVPYLKDKSHIVIAYGLTALAHLAEGDAKLQSEVGKEIERALKSSSAAVRARARLLVKARQKARAG
jgi:hypothetical protein